MKINQEKPVSAFAVYSEKFRQKKKKKPVIGGVNKPTTQKSKEFNQKEMKEIQNILLALAKQAEGQSADALSKLTTSGVKIKKKKNNRENSIVESDKGSTERTKVDVDCEQILKKGKYISSKNGDSRVHKSKTNNRQKSSSISLVKMENNIESTRSESPDSHKEKRPLGTKSNTEAKKVKNISSPNIKIKSKANKSGNVPNNDIHCETSSEHKKKKLKIRNKGHKSGIVEENTLKKQKLSENRRETARQLFQWLIEPIPEEEFMKNYWEQRPLVVRRDSDRSYYSGLLSTAAIDAMLRENVVHFTKHLDVTSYTDGVRETHNLTGRAQANVVWDFYANGCSVRLLSPQTFAPRLHALNATLQEWFGCLVGANAYLTPPSSQGFAPHYDDIEAFVLQIEGSKRWKVYAPRSESETLPRTSSGNFTQAEVEGAGRPAPLLDVTLHPGDLLYFPRGFVHQASTAASDTDAHSLHITLSAYQRNAWIDLLEHALPIALKRAAAAEPQLRRGLPLDYLSVEHGPDEGKAAFAREADRLMGVVGRYLGQSLGAAVDRMGARFMHDALPPLLTAEEMRLSSRGGGLAMEEGGKLADDNAPDFHLDTHVKLISTNVCRLVESEEGEGGGEVRLYHCLDNQLEYHAEEPQFLVLPPEGVEPVTRLCRDYPHYTRVSDLPHSDPDALLTLVSDLWDAGLLLVRGD